MVNKKLLKVGIYVLIGGILTTPLVVGFCIAPLGLLLMFLSIVKIEPEIELTHLEHIAKAKGYVKYGFDDMGRQLYGPPDPSRYTRNVEFIPQHKEE